MRLRGICYDVGRVMMGQDWRPDFEPSTVRRELAILRNDLNCNAVRICGQDLDRLSTAAALALDQGLSVWLSPELWDESQDATLAYIASAASRAEELRRTHAGDLTLSIGSELTLFMQGIVEGKTLLERLANPSLWDFLRAGRHNAPLNAFLAKAHAAARASFTGPLTYASVPLETVDWSLFDYVATDLYRDARIRAEFPQLVRRSQGAGKPLVITEFGCCTYRGAADAGGRGWAIVNPDTTPPAWQGSYERDESEQAHELSEVLGIFDDEGVDGAFAMTFIAPLLPTSDGPAYDLDMASYSLVKIHPDRPGETYPGLRWEPKESFHAVAAYYGACKGQP